MLAEVFWDPKFKNLRILKLVSRKQQKQPSAVGDQAGVLDDFYVGPIIFGPQHHLSPDDGQRLKRCCCIRDKTFHSWTKHYFNGYSAQLLLVDSKFVDGENLLIGAISLILGRKFAN